MNLWVRSENEELSAWFNVVTMCLDGLVCGSTVAFSKGSNKKSRLEFGS